MCQRTYSIANIMDFDDWIDYITQGALDPYTFLHGSWNYGHRWYTCSDYYHLSNLDLSDMKQALASVRISRRDKCLFIYGNILADLV